MNIKEANSSLDKIQGDKKSNRSTRLERIDEITNTIALLPDSLARTTIITRIGKLARKIEYNEM